MSKIFSERVFIVAELSANHNQSKEIAMETIMAAKEAGADAIKLQTYTADTMTLDSDSPLFRIHGGTLWDGKTLYELYQEAYTPWEWHSELFILARKLGLVCFSTPFDRTAVDFLENLNNPVYKIASFEITDIPLISYIASKGKPIIISTGIADEEDISLALETIREKGNDEICLLKCTSSYPAKLSDANLLTIPDMKSRFKVHVGLSDHTEGTTAAVTSVAIGARVIEKHFILDRNIGGPDAAFSIEPAEFRRMVIQIREVESALGTVNYDPGESARKNRKFSRSIFVIEDIKRGELFTGGNIRSIRPGDGMHPKYYESIIGKRAAKDIKRGTPLNDDLIT